MHEVSLAIRPPVPLAGFMAIQPRLVSLKALHALLLRTLFHPAHDERVYFRQLFKSMGKLQKGNTCSLSRSVQIHARSEVK
jgi:hypothetical protein